MTIQNINVDYTGQVGILPRTVKVISNDSYATVTSAGYLNNSVVNSYSYYPTDVFLVSYLNNAFGIFQPTFSGTTITLAPWVNLANGSPSDPTKPKVASVNGATVIGQVPTFSDTAGTIQTGGVLLSAVQLAANIKSFVYSYAGGSATATIPLAGITTSSVPFADIATSTNPAVINTVKILGAGNITVVFSADPGASTINIVAFIAPQ